MLRNALGQLCSRRAVEARLLQGLQNGILLNAIKIILQRILAIGAGGGCRALEGSAAVTAVCGDGPRALRNRRRGRRTSAAYILSGCIASIPLINLNTPALGVRAELCS